MELPKKFARRRGLLFYLQIAAAVVGLILGIAQMTKESAPIIQKMQENQHQMMLQREQQAAQTRAAQIAQMNIAWQYRGNDGTWRYYSDQNSQFWCRVNIQGVQEYSENPNSRIQTAGNNVIYR